MRNYFPLIVMLSSLAISCKSFDNKLLTNKEIIDKSIKPMQVIVNYESLLSCYPFQHFFKYNISEHTPFIGGGPPIPMNEYYFSELDEFIAVIKNNLTYETEPENYYLSIIVRKVDITSNAAWLFPGSLTLGILYLLGWPSWSMTYIVELDSAIISPEGKVLKIYKVVGTETEYCASYYGYSGFGDMNKTAMIKALVIACKEIREQLKSDVDNINRLVK